MTKDEFIKSVLNLGISLNQDQINKLDLYKDLLKEWNNKFNLTTIISDEDIYLKHFFDSLFIISKLNIHGSLCDFGTGAGFPGMVIAIIQSNIKIDLIESNGKKCEFLKEVQKKLNLNNVTIINDRMENYSRKVKEKYDYIVCRAVSNLGIICEVCINALKIGGYFTPYKTNAKVEYDFYKKNIEKLCFKLENIIEYRLPFENSIRNIPVFNKTKENDKKYPRNYNIIKKDNKNISQ